MAGPGVRGRGVTLRVLRLGTSRVDKAALLLPELEPGTMVETPVYAYLLETADGRSILVDTGMHPCTSAIRTRASTPGSRPS